MNWDLYRRFLPFVRPYRWQLIVVFLATLARPALSAAKVWLLKVVIDNVILGKQPDLLLWVCTGYIVITVARGLASYLDDFVGGRVGTRIVRDLRVTLYDHLQGLSLRFYHNQRLGDLLTRLTSDIGAIEEMLVSGIVDLLSRAFTIVLFVGILFYLNSSLALVSLVVIPALVLVSVIYARRSHVTQVAIRERLSALTSKAEEGLSAIALVKAFAREPFEHARFTQASTDSSDARLRAVRVQAVFNPVVDLVSTVGMVLVVWLGTQLVLSGQFTVGGLVVFLGYLGSLYAPIQGLSRQGASIQRALVGAARVGEILNAPAGQRERRGRLDLSPGLEAYGLVEFRDVTFGYVPEHPVLRGLSLAIRPGEVVALVGASGAGKTTVVSLLLSYYDADTGAIEIDGKDTRDFNPPSVRRQVAAVLQEPMLFQASVRENIRYGRLDASDADVEEAARAAGADDFIQGLSERYDTQVGPRGARLSGGQRQRLAIARALLKDAPIVVLDEATSALDSLSEARVMQALRTGLADRAVLLVAHRLSTVRHADRIAVLSEGRIAEIGTHEELLALGGLYYRFYESQQGATPVRPAEVAIH
jgi:ATP-binding cassette subfamily B protein